MAHHTVKSGFDELVERLNRFPQGAPPSELLYRILRILVSDREAALVARLPIRPFTAARAATLWKVPEAEARTTLDALASRSVLLDMTRDGETLYTLPPPMAGFFEFSLMRLREDIDQKVLAELFYQYLNVEEAFVRELFSGGVTRLGRVFVDEGALPQDEPLEVLDYERAEEVVRTATAIGVGLCYCRHKMSHVGRACDAPLDNCMTFNTCAASLTRHGTARPVEASECLDLLQQARERGLVQFGDNVRRGVSFLCNCCGCCCEALLAAKRFGHLRPLHTTGFLPEVDGRACTGCGKCARACPVEAATLSPAPAPGGPKGRRARIDVDRCLGCGVCVRACAPRALSLRRRPSRLLTPANTAHRVVLMALERGKFAELVVDGQSTFGHRATAALLGAVLKLPPLKQALASRQLRSRYLEALLAKA